MSRRFVELPTPILEAIRVTGGRATVDGGKPEVGSLLTEQLHKKISGRLKNDGRVVIAVNGDGEILEIGDSEKELSPNLGVEAVSYLSFEEEPDDLSPILPDHEMSSSRPRRLTQRPVLAVVDPSIVLDAFATTGSTNISSAGPCGDVFQLIAGAEVVPVLTPQLQGELEDMVGHSRGKRAMLNDGQQHGIETYLRRGELFQNNGGLGADDHVVHRKCERVLVRAARVSGKAEIVTPSHHLRRSAKKLGLKTQGPEEFLEMLRALQFAAQE